MTYQYEPQLNKKAQEFIKKLERAGFVANIIPNSMREFNLKIGVSKNNQSAETILLYYSPKKDRFSLKYHEMKNHALEPELEAIWHEKSSSPPPGVVQAANGGIEIFVDGSFQADVKAIGYGVVIVQNEQVIKEIMGQPPTSETPSLLESHQIAGEIYGVRSAIEWCQQNNVTDVTLAYDYAGLEKWTTGEWKAKKALTLAYAKFIQNSGINITWRKVAAHTGQQWNERADTLAKQAISAQVQNENESDVDLMTEAQQTVHEFAKFLQTREFTVQIDATVRSQHYVRQRLYQSGQEIGYCDLYNTKKHRLNPRWQQITDPTRQSQLEMLWQEFRTGQAPTPLDSAPVAPSGSFAEVDYYYAILKPYADYAFDFIDLARAIARAAANQSIRLESFDPETARYNYQLIEMAYHILRTETDV